MELLGQLDDVDAAIVWQACQDRMAGQQDASADTPSVEPTLVQNGEAKNE